MFNLLGAVLLVIFLGPLVLCIVLELLTLVVMAIESVYNMFVSIGNGISAVFHSPTLWMIIGGLIIVGSIAVGVS